MTAVAKLPEISTFIEQMDMLRDDFVKYQDGNKSVPFVVLRDALVAALNAYDDARAALSPAELGGVEDYVDPLDVFLSQGVDDVPCLQVPGRVLALFVPGSWDCAYEMFSGNTPTPRAAEVVTDGDALFLLECADTLAKDFRHHMADKLREFVKQKALTPPSAKGE